MKNTKKSSSLFLPQKGVVLIVALIMLLVMTLIGITVMSGSTLQEQMAGNNRQLSLARLDAEAALRQAEEFLSGLDVEYPADVRSEFLGKSGLYVTHYKYNKDLETAPTVDFTELSTWTNTAYSVGATGLNTSSPPRYAIEYIGQRIELGNQKIAVDREDKVFANADSSPLIFRITAIGYGQNDNIVSILQSIYSTQQGSAPP